MAEATGTELAVADGVSTDESAATGGSFVDNIGGVDVMRQVMLIIALVIAIAIAILIFFWTQEPEYRPLAKMETQELIETLDFLDQNQVDYRLEGNTVYVSEKEYQGIKLNMARQGLSQSPSSGSDIIMQDMGFGVSQRLEQERLKHAREQQIARTIEALGIVTRARVLLAMPKQNVFSRRSQKASATAVLTVSRGRTMKASEVDAVVDIIASAVQDLEPSRITITDHHGRLLNSGSQDEASARSRKEYELEKKREDEYLEKIDSILIPVLGLGNYTAQADVSMDFTTVEQTQKRYNPDGPAVRSEMTMENNTVGSVIAGIPGALTNQPPLNSNLPEQATNNGNSSSSAPGSSRKEATRNYELDTTISHTKQQTGAIRRLSVSVALNYKTVVNAEGVADLQPRTEQELQNIRRLLQGGLGFDTTRGDSLEVVSVPFVSDEDVVVEDVPYWEQPWVWRAAKYATGMIAFIALLFGLIIPMLKRLIYPEDTKDAEDDADSGLDLGDDTITMLSSSSFDEDSVGFAADGKLMLPDLHKDEDVLKAVRALVANEPELSAQVVKGWLNMDV